MRNLMTLGVLIVLTVLVQGCISLGKESPETGYYLLTAEAQSPQAMTSPGPARLLSVGPVLIPDFLDRPQIVTREGSRARIADLHRWAEPLDTSVLRVVSVNIERLYPHWQTAGHLAPQAFKAERSLRLEVRRLDGSPGQQAIIDILWELTDNTADLAPVSGRFQQTLAQNGSSYEALVKALSEGLVQLCRELPLS